MEGGCALAWNRRSVPTLSSKRSLYIKHNLILKGGIRTSKEACIFMMLMKEELDNEWTTNKLFRMGASALLNDIERQIYHYVTGRYANTNELP